MDFHCAKALNVMQLTLCQCKNGLRYSFRYKPNLMDCAHIPVLNRRTASRFEYSVLLPQRSPVRILHFREWTTKTLWFNLKEFSSNYQRRFLISSCFFSDVSEYIDEILVLHFQFYVSPGHSVLYNECTHQLCMTLL
jgi:hypothetical protein